MAFDRSFLQNPIWEYFKWLKTKIMYQRKYKTLRIGYKSMLHNVKFGKYNWTGNNVYIENSSIGDFSYVTNNCVILESTIGKYCSIGPNVRMAPGKHPTHTFVSTHPSLFSNPAYCQRNFQTKDHHNPQRHVTIGNDVWICANVVIADGVNIGSGVIIGANSVVTKDIEPYCIVGGIPARIIRKRFKDDDIEYLLNLKWWDKDIEWIKENADKFLNIDKLSPR